MKICGIYALTFGDKIIYIGQSKDIEGRVKAHLRWQSQIKSILKKVEERGGIFTDGEKVGYQRYKFIGEHLEEINWKVIEQCKECYLDDYEGYYIRKYRPEFNYEGVRGLYYGQNYGRRKRRAEVAKNQEERCAW